MIDAQSLLLVASPFPKELPAEHTDQLRGPRRLAVADLVSCIDEMDSSCDLVGI